VPFQARADRSIRRHKACRLRGSDSVQNGTAFIIAVASEQAEQAGLRSDLDALVREGARRMLLAALKAEVDEYVSQHAGVCDEAGHAMVVRNGVGEPQTVTTKAGELEVQAARVNDRRENRRFTRAILPPWARRSPKVADVLPVLYLYRAVDEHGQVVDVLLRDHRNALHPLKRSSSGRSPAQAERHRHRPPSAVHQGHPADRSNRSACSDGLHAANGVTTKPFERSHVPAGSYALIT
jgi:hypothetical protein